jgi:hypothetical protein
VVDLMSKDRLVTPWALRVVLIALAVQGMTPDPTDLASDVLPRILRGIVLGATGRAPGAGHLRGAVAPATDSTWPDEPGSETPDEVCGVSSREASVAVSSSKRCRSAQGLHEATGGIPNLLSHLPARVRAPVVGPGPLLRLNVLCRRTC